MWNPTHPILILALSGRALAQAAAAAGYKVYVIDCYADQETRQTASAWVQIPLNAKFDHWRQGIIQLINKTSKPVGFLYGGGLEEHPRLMAELNLWGRLFGNSPACLRLLKDPRRFFPLLRELAIPAPETQLHPPRDPRGWLRKGIAGTGGCHILPAEVTSGNAGYYYQRRFAGQPGSVLFLANGKTVRILGYHRLWTAPTPAAPYRYGGMAALLHPPSWLGVRLQNYLAALVAATGLRGLNGLDFIQKQEDIQVLEINPRPPASVDLYQDFPLNLFEAHIQACLGGPLPLAIPRLPTVRAFAVFYAPRLLSIPPSLIWPPFCRDRPVANSTVEEGQPICSIHAMAPSITACRRLIARRQRRMLKRFTSNTRYFPIS